MLDVCVGTSVGTITEPDCLGPCEPGTSVTLEGIVWHETEGGEWYLTAAAWSPYSQNGAGTRHRLHRIIPPRPHSLSTVPHPPSFRTPPYPPQFSKVLRPCLSFYPLVLPSDSLFSCESPPYFLLSSTAITLVPTQQVRTQHDLHSLPNKKTDYEVEWLSRKLLWFTALPLLRCL
jgi:hypothetical protein